MTIQDIAQVATAYCQRGWAVIPVRAGAKLPIELDWPNKGRRTAAEVQAAWALYPDANVGILTGLVSGLWVLDVDPQNGGMAALAGLIAAYGQLPETYVVRTPSGGLHYYFLLPEDFEPRNAQHGRRAGRLPVGIDVRGRGGQVVAPPSVRSEGAYVVLVDFPLSPAPEWLLDMLRPIEAPPQTDWAGPDGMAGGASAVGSTSYASVAVARLLDEMATALPGTRNEIAYRVGRRLAELVNSPWCGLDGAQIFEAFMAAAAAANIDGQFSAAEAEATLRKAVAGQAGRGVAPPPMPPEMSGTAWTPPPMLDAGKTDTSGNGQGAGQPGQGAGQSDFDHAGQDPAAIFTSPGAAVALMEAAVPLINDIAEQPEPSAWDHAVAVAVSRIYVNEEAKRQVEQAKFLQSWRKPITYGDLALELSLPESDVTWRIAGLLPADGNGVVVAPRKTGKTTLIGELVRSLADGVPFLGHACTAVTGGVALFNYENTERQQRAWLRALGITNQDRVHVLHLRGSALSLNVPQVRSYVTQWLRERAIEVWIPDPYLRAAQGVVLNENDNGQANVFTGVLDEIKLESGVREIVMPAHSSNKNEIESGAESMRGAGRVEDWADAIWYLTSVEGQRFIRATGRDVELPETQMQFDSLTRRLSIGRPGHGRKEAALEGDVAQVSKVLREWSEATPATQNQLAEACGGWRAQRVRAAVVWLVDRNLAWIENGPNNSKYHHHGAKTQPTDSSATGGATQVLRRSSET